MIYKESSNSYRISTPGEKNDLVLTEQELLIRLGNRGVWTGKQMCELIAQDVGYMTPEPFGKYV